MWLKTAAVRKHSNAQNSGEPQAREPLSHGRRRGRHCNLLVHRPFTRTAKSVSEGRVGASARQHLPHLTQAVGKRCYFRSGSPVPTT